MDMQMPECDGITATKAIRKKCSPAQLQIIALTANAQQSDREACFNAGMQDFVAKPFKPEEILKTIQKSVASLSNKQIEVNESPIT